MPIRVRCPRCWETAEVPDDALGKRGVCNRCGAQVMVPAKLTKVCFICGADVTRTRHTKDLEGNYLCMSCYETRKPEQQASFMVPTLECSLCHAQFAEGEGRTRDGKPVCRDCAGHSSVFGELDIDALVQRELSDEEGAGSDRTLTRKEAAPSPGESALAAAAASLSTLTSDHPVGEQESHPHTWGKSLLEQADEIQLGPPRPAHSGAPATAPNGRKAGERKGTGRGAMVLALLALAGVGLVGWMQYRQSRTGWEDENRAKIITLRAQGQVLVEVGKVKEGLAKYEELARLVAGRSFKDASLQREVNEARLEMRQAAMSGGDAWEEENRLGLMILKAQGEVLALAGKYPEAIEKYAELLRQAKGHAVSPGLADELKQARAQLQQAQAAWEREQHAAMLAARSRPSASQTPRPAEQQVAPEKSAPVPAIQEPERVTRQPQSVPPHRSNIFDDAPAEHPVKTPTETPEPAHRPVPSPAPSTQRSIFD